MRGQLCVVVKAERGGVCESAERSRTPRSENNPLDITLAHLFANETFLVLVSHVLEQLVGRKERLVAELGKVSRAISSSTSANPIS